MKMKRLNLVTGASGFSGAYVVRDLLNRGEKVIGTDLAPALENPKNRRMLESIGFDYNHPNLELIPSDLLDKESLKKLFKKPVTHIFHTASLYDYSASLELLRRVNVDGTRNLMEQVLNSDSLEHFIHWSTCGVFGKPFTAAQGQKVNLPFSEESSSPKNTDGPSPEGTYLVNDYSVTKWEQEQMMWRYHRENKLPLTVVRPAPIYGPGSTYGHGGIILVIAHGILPVIPLDCKNYITTSVHVEDMGRFAIFAGDRPDLIGEDFNVVDNSIISYYEFLRYIALLTGRKMIDIPFVRVPKLYPIMAKAAVIWTNLQQRYGIPRIRVFEIQSAEYVSSSYWLSNRKSLKTGFQYLYPDVKEGLKDTVDWFRKMGFLTDKSELMVSGGRTAKT